MTVIYRVFKDASRNQCLVVDESGQVVSQSQDIKERDNSFVVAVDGRLTRSFHLVFPARVKRVLPAVQFALEPTLAEPLEEQLFFLQKKSFAKESHGFVISKKQWRNLSSEIDSLPCLPKAIYPDYLFLPWSEGLLTIAYEGDWCRIRYGKHEGCSVSASSMPLLLKALTKQYEIDQVLVFGDDSSIVWAELTSVPVIVLNQAVNWELESLPKAASVQGHKLLACLRKRQCVELMASKLCRFSLICVIAGFCAFKLMSLYF